MEKIHIFSLATAVAKKYWGISVFVLLALLLLVFVRVNAEAYNLGVYHSDEYHTIYEGLNLLVNGRVDNFRAQESVRWLVRAFYPYALIYMNTHIGGNVYIDGWGYPGHNYVVKNYIQKDQSTTFSLDPNLRNLFHALREQYIFFVAACIFALLLFFFRERYYLVAFGGLLLLGTSIDLITEQKILYLEPGIVASLALMLLTYCYYLSRGYVTRATPLLFGFIGAAMISTKFSTLFFLVLPLILFFYFLRRGQALKYGGVYIASFVASYLLINFPAFMSLESFNLFLHDLSSNFWQYAAGSDPGLTVASGVPYLGMLVSQLEGFMGYTIYLLPVLVLFALWYATTKERLVLIPTIIITFLSVYSLSGQHVYLVRNLIPFYLPITIVSLLSIEVLVRTYWPIYGRTRVLSALAILAVLWLGGSVIHQGGVGAFASQLFPNAKAGFVAELELRNHSTATSTWYTVGFSKNFFEGDTFAPKIMPRDSVPNILSSKNYPDVVAQFSSLPKDSVVLVNNVGNNKHLTNYILPKCFSDNVQFGQYYAFFNSK
jgi:hypothetical protein